MPLSLRTADARVDPATRNLIDAVFERTGRESELARRIAECFPSYDPGLALAAQEDGRDVGWALFLPRVFRLRGAWVPLAVSAPIGTLPEARRRGVGRFLLQAGRQAMLDRGLRGAVVLGGAEFFSRIGYHPAFNLYTTTAHATDLPSDPEPHTWRALQSGDIPHLREIHACNYAQASGTEQRSDAPADWESSGESCYTLVLEREGEVAGFLRFRARERLEVPECATRDADATESTLRLMHRLIEEHGRTRIEVHVPPSHPVTRTLFHRGDSRQVNNFGGAALFSVADWRGLFEDTGETWARSLRAVGDAPISLDLDGETLRLSLTPGDAAENRSTLVVGSERVAERHLWIPPALAPGLVTGQRSHLDLAEDERVHERSRLDTAGEELLPLLFPGGSPQWTYSPLYELADD